MAWSAAASRAWYHKNRDAVRQQIRYRRRNNVALAILQDARKDDRRKKRENDLDLNFVAALIQQPCSYCGDEDLRRTLDRIDNTQGHTRENVVLACERCNYVRRNMPYDAWLIVAPGMRTARIQGLFGEWTGAIHKRTTVEKVSIKSRPRSPPHGTFAGYKKCGPPTCQPCRDAMAAWKRGRRARARAQ